ncbi:MAG: hypothetical protein V4643_10635 [Bacteroidota bacterium]
MSPKIIKCTALISFLLVIYSITQFKSHQVVVKRAIYYWKNNATFNWYQGDTVYPQFIDTHQIKKVYVKMLDVDWVFKQGIVPITKTYLSEYSDGLNFFRPYVHNQPIPESGYESDRLRQDIQFVPVVFITNKAIAHMDSSSENYLAEQILKHLFRIQKYAGQEITEYQLDCDWTATTQRQYFSLIRKMKSYLPTKKVSATIRLYQYKYFNKAGVPPVDKGMLMLYNINNATKYSTQNSIFNLSEAVKYLPPNHPYPLSLSVALPMFSWGILFNNYTFKAVVNEMNKTQAKELGFLQQLNANDFVVKYDTVFNNVNYETGNILKIEQCYDTEITQANFAMHRIAAKDTLEVALFDLNATDIKHINHESIEKAYTW